MIRAVVLSAVLSSHFVSTAVAQQAKILVQDSSPLTIETYTSRYMPPDRVGDGSIIHRATVINSSGQGVEAYGIGFYIFDAFDRDMGRPFIGYSMSPVSIGSDDRVGFEQRPRSAFLFDRHGKSLAYISIVRMEDGTIWKADGDDVARQIEDYELEIVGEDTSGE